MHWTKPFQALALAGFSVSVTSHFLAITGMVETFPSSVMLLHGGVFIVFIPAVIVGNRAAKGIPRKDVWKVMLAHSPAWLRRVFWSVCIYVLLNFMTFTFTVPTGMPTGKDSPLGVGAAVVRAFSGHWMVFYLAAFVILYSEECRKRQAAEETVH